jgi:hypothetical protein
MVAVRFGFSIYQHRPKFKARELLSSVPNPTLKEQHRSRRPEPDQHRNGSTQQKQTGRKKDYYRKIQDPFPWGKATLAAQNLSTSYVLTIHKKLITPPLSTWVTAGVDAPGASQSH